MAPNAKTTQGPPQLTKHEIDQINTSRSQGTSFIDQESMHELQRSGSADKQDVVTTTTNAPGGTRGGILKGLDLGPILQMDIIPSLVTNTSQHLRTRPETGYKEPRVHCEGTSAEPQDASSLPKSL